MDNESEIRQRILRHARMYLTQRISQLEHEPWSGPNGFIENQTSIRNLLEAKAMLDNHAVGNP